MFKDITLKEAQAIEFEMLRAFRALCEEQGLTFFLSGGTLLGAVRHSGFIPWDDDIDVMMPRADYDRLISSELKLPGELKLFCCEKDDSYFYPYARLCDMRYRLYYEGHRAEASQGMYIDIFPIETLPDGTLERKLYFKRMRLWDVLRNCARRESVMENEKHRGLKRLLGPVARLRGPMWYARRMNALARGYAGKETAHAGVTMVTHYGEREWMPKAVFEPGATVSFEGERCAAPKGYDAYLTRLYGDYMQLPPEEKRVSEHIHYTIEVRD